MEEKKKILIVDDEPDIVKIIKAKGKAEDYQVVTANDGYEGYSKARSEIPDLIILDLMLPKINGYEVCAMLKRDTNFMQIPIIMLTARAGDESKKLGEQLGADSYITKPFDIQELFSKIAELLKK